ncbi:MAG: ABC transporter ATP-binding protein [Candidatus Hodarchaeales archaeon]|jgi:energy-coupling factor transporter ATP-binding protein EcfA2
MLRISDLGVKYAGSSTWTLEKVSFTARPGQLTLITGLSGSGKSTLAQTIMTLIPKFYSAIVQGEIQVNNRSLHTFSRPELIKLFGYVPQYPADFVTTLSVEEEVGLVLENLGLLPEEILLRMDEVFTSLKIGHLRKRIQTELSSGELQRVALASALSPDVPILIFDEPMARIDLKSELLLVNLLKELVHEGKTVLAFEHRLDYLLEIADKVIVLDEGLVVAQGKPKEVIKQLLAIDPPEISLMNIKPGKIPISLAEAQEMLKSLLL